MQNRFVLTGVATGAVTQAAVGVALNTSINVSDRPVTGQGVTGMKGGGAMQPGRLVEDGKCSLVHILFTFHAFLFWLG